MDRRLRRALTGGALALALIVPGTLAAQDAIGLALGTQAPAASVEDLEGKPVQLLDLIKPGKPALLEFWATWCEQCAALQPQLDRIQKEMGSQINVVAVAVGVAQTPRRVQRTSRITTPATHTSSTRAAMRSGNTRQPPRRS